MTAPARPAKLRAWALDHPFAAAEALFALGLFAILVATPVGRTLLRALLLAVAAGARAAIELCPDDAPGVLRAAACILLPAALVLAPLGRLLRFAAPHRRAWIPLGAALGLMALPLALPAFSTVRAFIALVVASALGFAAAGVARRRWLRALAFAPFALTLEPLLGHGPLSDVAWPRDRLAARCAANDGRRPVGFDVAEANTRFYGLTPLDDRLYLLTGERASRWLARTPEGLAVVDASRAVGNLWQGCALDGGLWLTKRGLLIHVERHDGGERVTERPLPDPPGTVEPDLVDAVCAPELGAVFVSELVGGGVRELSVGSGRIGRHDLGAGGNLQMVRRPDGVVAAIDTTRLFDWSPRSDRVLDARAAGIVAMGLDVCPADGAAAVADMAGRVRLFRRTDGGYRFERAASLEAPRRVAFSTDCSRLAVTSADDSTVWVLRRADLAVEHTYAAGPGLRDLVWLDARWVAVADAGGAEVLDGG